MVSYAEDMISHQLVAGLRSLDFQSGVLSEAAVLTTLDAKIARLQSLESTDECAQLLHPSYEHTKVAAAKHKSQHKMRQQNQMTERPEQPRSSYKDSSDQPKCKGCGRRSHGKGKPISKNDCPAKNQKCLSCGKIGHFRVVCRNKSERSPMQKSRANKVVGDSESNSEEDNEAALASTTTFF